MNIEIKGNFSEQAEATLDRASVLLQHINGGIYQAAGSAIQRANQHGTTIGTQIITEQYALTTATAKHYTRVTSSTQTDSRTSYRASFTYRGQLIPLIQFDTIHAKGGHVKTHVLRNNAAKALDHAFITKAGGSTHVFERTGSSRLPIAAKYGPSVVHAFISHPDAVQKMSDALMGTFVQRMEHEITRLLNGWGSTK